MDDMTILGARVQFELPKSAAARWDVLALSGSNLRRAAAMALALCWPKLGRKVRQAGIDYTGDNPAVFGGRVLDYLIGEGASLREVMAAGAQAIDLCAHDLPGSDQIEAELGNSDGGEGSTTE